MHDAADVELDKDSAPQLTRPSRPPSPAPWIVAALVAIALAGAAYFYFRPQPASQAAPQGQLSTEAKVEPSPPLGAEVTPIDLPPLDETDALVRQLVRMLSQHPRVVAWLTTNGLIRNFVVVVDNIASGQTPARHLRVVLPMRPFKVADANGTPVVDARGYESYNPIADATASIKPGDAAKLYSTLKPRIEDAYRELGRSESFDVRLEKAIVHLLEAPAPQGELVLTPKGGVYAYDDPSLQQLSAAQKQLVRMGPRNVRSIQRSLRAIALALGIPASHLPAR